ncbi:MAG: UDP-glucose 4-epimerase GalE [Clostridiales bacterium]|nr:UDP-glucose 4-epimerase GalE [Clostridiales bacterium]
MTILVTGGAGYIGSHMVKLLQEQNEEVIVIDNLSTGSAKSISEAKLYIGDIRDKEIMTNIFTENKIDAVIHFAADSRVAESVANPLKYYNNNLHGTATLLEFMVKYGVKYIVFSSTAAVYGNSETNIITEETKTNPESPYGETKLAIEQMMEWVSSAHGIYYTALRYFNACGAHESGLIGESRNHETHLIPLVLQVALGKRKKINIYGDDYATKDGTCIRDYIHVTDLANAHIKAVKWMKKYKKSGIFNLGNGKGFSVQEIVDYARKVTKKPILAEVDSRRAGDPDKLVASNQLAKEELKWVPKITKIDDIIKSAWKFMNNFPDGYGG